MMDEKKIVAILQRNAGQLVQYLRPFFAPASLNQAPQAATTATGSRSVTVTRNQIISDSAVLPLLAGGVCTWKFKQKFTTAPTVTALAQGPYTGAGASVEIFVDHQAPPTTVIAIIKSSQTDDNRMLHLQAVQLPD